MKFLFGSRSKTKKFNEPGWKIIKICCKIKGGMFNQMTSRSLFQPQPFCDSLNFLSNQENSPGVETDLTEILQGLSVCTWIFSHQRKVLASIMAGKKTKTKGLKIVYFPTNIRRISQMNALEDFFFLFSDCINFQPELCWIISSSEAGPTFASSNTVIKQ